MSIAKIILDNSLTPEEFYSNINNNGGNNMNISKQVVILSATKDNDSIENTNFRTKTLKNVLTDINLAFAEATGVYKGKTETSFVVVVNSQDDIENLKSLAFNSFQQESILVQDSNQEAFLVFNNNKTLNLGRLEAVTPDQAKKLDSYTILNDTYYAIPKPSRLA